MEVSGTESQSVAAARSFAFVWLVCAYVLYGLVLQQFPQSSIVVTSRESYVSGLSALSVEYGSLPNVTNASVVQGDAHAESPSTSTTTTKTKRPKFVFHVGPPKMATSTLQRDCVNFTKDGTLALDNYAYVGEFSNDKKIFITLLGHSCFRAMEAAERFNEVECWKALTENLRGHYKAGHNVILSTENLSFAKYPIFQYPKALEYIAETWKDWDVQVIIGYRRYAEWTLSAVKQKHGRPRGGCLFKGWGHACSDPWTDIREWSTATPPSAHVYQYTDTVVALWESHGFSTTLMNFHSDEHVTTDFFCRILHDTPNTCRAARERPVNPKANSRSSSLSAYDSIVVAAEAKGLVDRNSKDRLHVRAELMDYHQGQLGMSMHDLPLLCPTMEELEMLLKTSLELEKKIVPEFFASEQGEAEHRDSFWKLVDQHEFCSIDTSTLLEDVASWDDLLEQIRDREWE